MHETLIALSDSNMPTYRLQQALHKLLKENSC